MHRLPQGARARLGDAVVCGDGLRHSVLPHEQAVPGRPVARVPASRRLARRLEPLPAATLPDAPQTGVTFGDVKIHKSTWPRTRTQMQLQHGPLMRRSH